MTPLRQRHDEGASSAVVAVESDKWLLLGFAVVVIIAVLAVLLGVFFGLLSWANWEPMPITPEFTERVVQSRLPLSIDASVGLIAVLMGIGGLAIGLCRHWWTSAAVSVPGVAQGQEDR